MGEYFVPLVALGTAAFFFLLSVGVLVLRRFLLGRGYGSFDCSLYDRSRRSGAGTWVLGMVRYQADSLDWFRVFALSPRPYRSMSRGELAILDHRDPVGTELHAVLPGWTIIRCAYQDDVLEFAMSEAAYNGFATWLESGPPGQNVAVT